MQKQKTFTSGNLGVSQDNLSQSIMEGFKINHMSLRDGQTNKLLWEACSWDNQLLQRQQKFPKQCLDCKIVSREIDFSSIKQIQDFKVSQKVFLCQQLIEEWNFDFGFVMPNSTNSWQNIIQAAEKDQMIDASVLSGNMIIETSFTSKNTTIYKSRMKVFYV